MTNPLTMLPPKVRGVIYLVMFMGGLVIGSIEASYSATGLAFPVWLVVTQTVFKYFVAAGFLTAASNVRLPDAYSRDTT